MGIKKSFMFLLDFFFLHAVVSTSFIRSYKFLSFFFPPQIVFSEAWWIGSKEENPEELRLEFPKNFNDVASSACLPLFLFLILPMHLTSNHFIYF